MLEKNLLKILSSEYYPLKYANKIDFLSDGVLNKTVERGINIKKKQILISPNSFILYDNFYPSYPKMNWVIFSARMTENKNPQLLLEAISILRDQGFTEYDYYFLGEGSLFTGLSIRKEELKLNNVYFEGGVSDPSIYLMKSKIFISIQSDNNYPSQSLLEAMASENAIVASDVGETRRIVTDKEGILIL